VVADGEAGGAAAGVGAGNVNKTHKQLVLDGRIVRLLGKLPIHGRLAPQMVRPIVRAEHSTVELGVVTIHSRAFTRTPNA